MDLSIIIPTRNRSHFLKRCLNYTPDLLQVIVVDDSSDLAPWQAVQALCDSKPNLLLVRQSVAKGAAAARNLGALHATTEWLCFLDDDDFLLPDYFLKMESLINTHSEVNAWLPDIRNCKRHRLGRVSLEELQITNRSGGCSGFMIRKDTFHRYKGFDPLFPSVQDWDLWIRIASRGELYYSGVLGVNYNTDSENKITYDLTNKYRGLRRLFYKHRGLWEPKSRRFHLIRSWSLRQLLRSDASGLNSCLKRAFKWPLALAYYLKWKNKAQ